MFGKVLFFAGLLIPVILVFKVLFLPGTAVWGDAPYFYAEALREFPLEPAAWTNWGNNFGGINQTLWLAPLMLIYKFLYLVFAFNNDVLIRTVFYFPAVLLSIITPIIFARSLGFGKIVQSFASLFYVFNTYFLLLIDGGQVGVALAYGLFPLSLVYIRNFLMQPDLSKFFLSLIFLSATTSFDPRVGLISVISVLVWFLSEALLERDKSSVINLKWLIPLGMSAAAVNSYWIIPILKLNEGVDKSISGLQLLSFFNGLFFFQPHWPANEFGRVSPPPFYFVGIPLLVFGALFAKRHKKILSIIITILFFTFLLKGTTPPLGEIYNWAIFNFPFGAGFRDSTKFFMPLFLFGGILIGVSVKYLQDKWRRFGWFIIAVYIYLLFLIHPALLGNLNGVLTQKALPEDFKIVHDKLTKENEFFRTLWFPGRNPFGFHTEEKNAIDAKSLVEYRPFSALNVGNDVFNFMHQGTEFLDWFNLLGIKYFIFSGDPRKLTRGEYERQDWDDLLKLTSTNPGLLKENWGTSFPVYSLSDIKPKIFTTDKLVAVLGSDDIYKNFRNGVKDFSVGNQVFVFFEDGKFEPRNLRGAASESAVLVFNRRSEDDLTMSFLQKYFIGTQNSDSSQFAIRNSREYLKWKYELLTKGVDTQEFDYGKGIAFSTQKGEEISFNIIIPEDGEYIFTWRSLSNDGQFKWSFEKDLNLKKGKLKKEFTNTSGNFVLNTIALIPKKDWIQAQDLTRQFVGHFRVVKVDELDKIPQSTWHELNFQKVSNQRYKIVAPEKISWIVFTDSYNPGWKLIKGKEMLPSSAFYSMVNGFYIEPKWVDTEIVFKGQEQVRWGMYWSLVSILFLAVVFLLMLRNKQSLMLRNKQSLFSRKLKNRNE